MRSRSHCNAAVSAWLLLFWLLLVLCGERRWVWAEEAQSVARNSSGQEHERKKSLAQRVETLVKNEFAEDVELAEQGVGKTFNETAKDQQATMETVFVISHKHRKDTNGTSDGMSRSGTTEGNKLSGSETTTHEAKTKKSIEHEPDVNRIVDSQDNEYVLSKSKEITALTVDPLLIQDLTILISSSATVGWLFEGMGQPVINGYLVAGSAVGPGGLKLIKELVQVESLAQLGVHFLLFHLGLEFSLHKMRAVGGVALVGGMLEMIIFLVIASVASVVTEAPFTVAIFVGALISLSSTSVVINCLEAKNRISSRAGQITVGTLILQDCTVGLLFALMPLLTRDTSSKTSEEQYDETAMLLLGTLLRLGAVVVTAIAVVKMFLPQVTRKLARSVSTELFQVSLIGFCLLGGLCVGALGVSHELGAFISGAMLSATEENEYAVRAIDGVRNLFMALFISSIGLVISPMFLWEHIGVLTVCTAAIVVGKSTVVFAVVKMFGFDSGTALMVALSLAQISEFAFVLLSVAQDSGLITQEMYLMLLGLAALSLLITPGVISGAASIVARMPSHMEVPIIDTHAVDVQLTVSEMDEEKQQIPAGGVHSLIQVTRRNKLHSTHSGQS